MQVVARSIPLDCIISVNIRWLALLALHHVGQVAVADHALITRHNPFHKIDANADSSLRHRALSVRTPSAAY